MMPTQPTRVPNTTNEDLIRRYLIERQTTRAWAPSTMRVRRSQLAIFSTQLGVPFITATEEDVLRWAATLDGMPETVASYISVAHGLFRWMSRRERIRPDDPSAILDRPSIPEALPRPMSDEHFDLALACSVSEVDLYLWLGLMGCSGLRCCEIAWMQTHDIELLPNGHGLAHIVGKKQKRRTVPIGEMLMLTLRPFLVGRGPVFTRVTDGKAYTPENVSHRTNRFLHGLGIHETAHQLRHRFGTDYHALDPDMYRQAKIMGHSSVDTTQRYTAVSPVEAARYIDVMTSRRMSHGTPRLGFHPAGRAAA